MTDNEAKREATFEEEYEILQKEKEELFAMENCDSEPSFANCVVRRASRCIRKLLEEIQQYRAMEEKLNGISVERVVNGFINVTEKGTDEGYERGRILTNAEADMWNEYRAIGTVEEFEALKEDKNFLEFLYNHIPPNEMEQYLSMYHIKEKIAVNGYADQSGLMSAT